MESSQWKRLHCSLVWEMEWNISGMTLATARGDGMAWKPWREGTTPNLIDPPLRANSGSMEEMENVSERPTIASVVLMLRSSSLSLPVGTVRASIFLHSGGTNSELPLLQEHNSKLAVSGHSINEVSITELFNYGIGHKGKNESPNAFAKRPPGLNSTGDVELHTCRSCINDSTIKLPQLLPNTKGAIGWYDYCMLHYSNESIKGIVATDPHYLMVNGRDALSMNDFKQAVNRMCSQAASGGAHCKFATGNTSGPAFQTIYGLIQGTPDLSETDCKNCLQRATANIPQYFGEKIGGRISTPSCNLRYENYTFFTEIPAAAPPATSDKLPPPPSVHYPIPAFTDDVLVGQPISRLLKLPQRVPPAPPQMRHLRHRPSTPSAAAERR
ncbi:hypothetical protein RHSIM_Rhsim07G0196400 [Rhododendron simsii]|uniref:Gnk2-homologous domain-containing protein n=1 Tax=Rhododendron simsii TaxID=118357 RepID=A0A834LJ95_RHOSS|nr:hypothetical protein RHSIM_Rhsim07G0196400 [Rhododendron simsii]